VRPLLKVFNNSTLKTFGLDELYWFIEKKSKSETRENVYLMTMISTLPRQIVGFKVQLNKSAIVNLHFPTKYGIMNENLLCDIQQKGNQLMFSMTELRSFLIGNNSDFEILAHDSPIISTQDAAKFFDMDKLAPTLIMDTDQGLVAFIISSKRGKIDFKGLKQLLGFSKLKMADKEKVKKSTGYQTGEIPLIGHDLPCVFDNSLFEHDYIYGGSGDELHTLKIVPEDVSRLNNVIKTI